MTIDDCNGKKVCMIGYGREGQSVVRALEKYAPEATITIADQNESITADHELQLGDSWMNDLGRFDVIIKSPGVPPQPEFEGVTITNGTQIFFDTVAAKGSTIIGVTGSKGKSTTASLIAAMLQKAGKDAHLVGNIGVPVLDFIEHAKEGTIFVQELSSFQLMDTTSSPHIAVVTSFFPDHLDYHQTLDAYMDAKKHITKFQTADDIVFYADNTPGAIEIANISKGQKHPYNEADALITLDDTKLIGKHNLINIGGAFRVAKHLELNSQDVIDAIKEFEGLPHRLQNIGEHHGVTWIDDAISTTPESTIAALDALPDVDVLICGGQDRGYDFVELGKKIDASNITTVILFPDSGPNIKASITKEVHDFDVDSMEAAIAIAKEVTKNTCLLSTASPSYNMFKNFEEKGDLFQRYAKA